MSTIDPELRKGFRLLPKMVLGPISVRVMSALTPLFFNKVPMEGITTEQLTPPGSSKTMFVHRRAGGASPVPVVLWIHGGGYIMGTPENEDRWAAGFLEAIDCVVVCAGYRLAPRDSFPAALDDLMAAIGWIRREGPAVGIDPSRLVVAGESAGGGLAAALVQRLHDDGVPMLGQLLVYPMLDDRTAVRSDVGRKDHLAWSNGSNHYGWSSYLGMEPGSSSVPEYAVPSRREDLTGLPPAWIGVGDMDLFYDENLEYARRLEAAGVPVRLETPIGAPHGFPFIAPAAQISRVFRASAVQFTVEALQAPATSD